MTTQAYYKDRLGFDPNDPREMTSLDPTLYGYEENLSKFKGLLHYSIVDYLSNTHHVPHSAFKKFAKKKAKVITNFLLDNGYC